MPFDRALPTLLSHPIPDRPSVAPAPAVCEVFPHFSPLGCLSCELAASPVNTTHLVINQVLLLEISCTVILHFNLTPVLLLNFPCTYALSSQLDCKLLEGRDYVLFTF